MRAPTPIATCGSVNVQGSVSPGTTAHLTPANTPDADAVPELVAAEPPDTQIIADSAYASGATLETLDKLDHTPVVKPIVRKPHKPTRSAHLLDQPRVGLVVEGGGAGVDVFGLFGVGSWECSPGESGHVSGCVPDGEDHPGAEDVVGAAPSGVGYTGLDGCLVVSEPVAQTAPLVGGPAQLPFGPIGGFDAPLG